MTGAFAMAVGSLGDLLSKLLAPVADFLGLDFIREMAAGSQDLMVQGAAKIADSANAFASALEAAKTQTSGNSAGFLWGRRIQRQNRSRMAINTAIRKRLDDSIGQSHPNITGNRLLTIRVLNC